MCIAMKEIWRNLDGPPKNEELWTYVVKCQFSRPKRSSDICVTEFVCFYLPPVNRHSYRN